MAIQDDNTVLNKGDLKAYHEAIAPMLGGTFMVRTNNSDYYSTDEKVVGVWIDGKPVYQKTIAITIGSGVQSVVYSFSEANIENLVDYSGYIYWTSAEILPIPWYSDADWNISAKIAGNQNIIISTHGYNGKSGYITVQYTKTTDTAGSATTTPGAYDINFPNTWPENTEIYFGNGLYGQRFTGTYACSAVSSSWDQSPTANLKLLSTSKAYHIVQQGGGVARNNGTFLPLVGTDSDANLALAFWCGTDGIYLRARDNNTNTNNYNIWCTYTK